VPALTRVMSSMLIGVKPTGPATYAVMEGVFFLVAAIASWLPAARRHWIRRWHYAANNTNQPQMNTDKTKPHKMLICVHLCSSLAIGFFRFLQGLQ
jgi:hypothetical protein